MPDWLRLLLALQAAAFSAYGSGCSSRPRASTVPARPWALTPLTAQAIAAFLLGFAVAAVIAVRGNSSQRSARRWTRRRLAPSSCWRCSST